jgi:alpha-L-rhamnosidase
MNSFNHYAYGSIVGWFYDTIAGLKPDQSSPGWKRFHISPTPGGGLSYAKASLETPYGLAASHWRQKDGRFELEVTIPVNTQAQVSLPAPSLESVSETGRSLKSIPAASAFRVENGRVHFSLGSGSYHFTVKP